MKIISNILIFCILISLVSGFIIKSSNYELGQKLIGISVLALFFVWMPIFIFYRYKGKDAKDYLLSKNIIDKIKREAEDF